MFFGVGYGVAESSERVIVGGIRLDTNVSKGREVRRQVQAHMWGCGRFRLNDLSAKMREEERNAHH